MAQNRLSTFFILFGFQEEIIICVPDFKEPIIHRRPNRDINIIQL